MPQHRVVDFSERKKVLRVTEVPIYSPANVVSDGDVYTATEDA